MKRIFFVGGKFWEKPAELSIVLNSDIAIISFLGRENTPPPPEKERVFRH